MNDHNPIKWGILGCGLIAHAFTKGLEEIPNATLEAVASNSGKAKPFAEKYGIQKWYDDYEEVVKDSNVDIIYIATTHNFHYENMLLCLNHRKPVLSEKPFTINASQTKHLIEIARENQIFMMEGMWTRFLPAVVKLREVVHDKETIGEVTHFRGDFCVRMTHKKEHRVFNPELAGGALLDVGVYPISFASMIMKQSPKRIASSVVLGETGVDIFSNISFTYSNDATATITSANKVEMPHNAYIVGTEGYIHVPDFSHPRKFFLYMNDGENKTFEFPYESTGFQYEALEAGECLLAKKIESETLPLEETLEIMETMDTLRSQWGFRYPEEI